MKIVKLLKETFIRRHFYLYDYFCQTNTLKECWLVLKHMVFKPLELKYGEDIRKYEEMAAKVMGAKYAYSYASGRHALYAILKALEIGEGDEVLVQGFTCVAVPKAVIFAGARPIYYDIDPNSLNMDIRGLEGNITRKTKAIIIQHTFGKMVNIDRVKEIISNYNDKIIYIIEDFAHAVGCGKLKGDIGFYSSDHTKMISTSSGGMAFTNGKYIAIKLISPYKRNYVMGYFRILHIAFTFIVETLITHPKVYWLLRPLRILLDKTKLFFFFRNENELDKPKNYPLKLSNLQAVIGISQLENLSGQLEKRKELTKSYYPKLRDYYTVPVNINETYMVKGVWFNSPIFGCKDLTSVYYKEGSCPIAEDICKKIVNLPIPLR